jgi:hypothetical protein
VQAWSTPRSHRTVLATNMPDGTVFRCAPRIALKLVALLISWLPIEPVTSASTPAHSPRP